MLPDTRVEQDTHPACGLRHLTFRPPSEVVPCLPLQI